MKILVVDDEKLLGQGHQIQSGERGLSGALTAYDGATAVELARQRDAATSSFWT